MEAVKKASDVLIQIMGELLDNINDMLAIAKKKETLLIKADVDRLSSVLVKEEELACDMREKEKELKDQAEILASHLGVTEKNIGLKALIELTEDPSCREVLETTRRKITDSATQLSLYNEKAKELLGFQLDYIELMLNLLLVPKSKNHSYNMQGSREDDRNELSILEYRA